MAHYKALGAVLGEVPPERRHRCGRGRLAKREAATPLLVSGASPPPLRAEGGAAGGAARSEGGEEAARRQEKLAAEAGEVLESAYSTLSNSVTRSVYDSVFLPLVDDYDEGDDGERKGGKGSGPADDRERKRSPAHLSPGLASAIRVPVVGTIVACFTGAGLAIGAAGLGAFYGCWWLACQPVRAVGGEEPLLDDSDDEYE